MADNATVNEWETESGLPDDFDGIITEAWFGPLYSKDQSVVLDNDGNPTVNLHWKMASPDIDLGEQSIAWSIGSGWTPDDKGAGVTHSNPNKVKFNNNSILGRALDRLRVDLKVDMRPFGSPRQAATYVGLAFHLKREKIEFVGGAERGIRPSIEHLMPVVFLGKDVDLSASKAAGGSAPAAVAPAANAGESPNGTTDAMSSKLVTLAKAMDEDAFQQAALKVDGVNDDPELLNSILESGPTGYWATARA